MSHNELNENLLATLWRVTRTVFQMCADRGYDVPEEEYNLSKQSFVERFGGEPLNNSPARSTIFSEPFSHKESSDDKLCVFMLDEPKAGVKDIRECVEKMDQHDARCGIIIVQQALTFSAAKAIRECNAAGNFIQVFEETELVVNVTQHELVPQHEVQTAEEKKDLLERYRLKESQLPRIKASDPIAKYYGLRRGQVVKITRNNSPTAGRYVTYRIVC